MVLRQLGQASLRLTCIVALVLSIAVAVFAVRSFWIHDLPQVRYQWYPTPDFYCARSFAVRSLSGTLGLGLVRNDFDLTSMSDRSGWADDFRKRYPRGFQGSYSTSSAAETNMQGSILLPKYEHTDHRLADNHDEYWMLTIPSWYVFSALLLFPTLYGKRLLRARARARQGLCAHCGYDLRASGDICPECGTSRAPVSTAQSAAE